MNDFDIIKAALKAASRLALSLRYGGLGLLYKLCQDALEALDRIESASLASLPLFNQK